MLLLGKEAGAHSERHMGSVRPVVLALCLHRPGFSSELEKQQQQQKSIPSFHDSGPVLIISYIRPFISPNRGKEHYFFLSPPVIWCLVTS